jgi:argininosuccinate lyase
MMALATDAADYLVDRGMPFREAHHCIGKAVLKAEQLNLPLEALPLTEWQAISPMVDSSIFDVFSLENAIEKRNAIGGTSKQMVRAQLEKAQQLLNKK